MSENAVRVDLRQANLSESAQLREAGDHVFLALDQPPPVRCLLRLTIGEEQKAFEVGRVVEVVTEEEPARGCYGAFVELERLDEQGKVGSEHLQPGISGSAVPSPVVIMNTGEMMLGEAGSEEDEAAASGEDSAADQASVDDGDSASAGDDAGESGEDADSSGDDAADAPS